MSGLHVRIRAIISQIEIRTRLTVNPRYSLTRLAVQKFRILVVFVARSILECWQLRLAHTHTRSIRGAYSDRDALIIAGGPSVSGLNIQNVLEAQRLHKLDVFAMNWYTEGDLSSTLIPNYYGLSDPLTKPSSDSIFKGVFAQSIWTKLKTWPDTKLLLPHTWRKLSNLIKNDVGIWFDDRELPGLSHSVSPVRPRGYISITAHKVIACAVYMGYRNIFIIGLDNSLFKSIEVDSENRIIEKPGHFYDTEESPNISRPSLYPNGVEDFLYDHSLLCLDLKRSFTAVNIFNIDKSSLTDAFPKIDSEFIDQDV
jgi:hypothetical protein